MFPVAPVEAPALALRDFGELDLSVPSEFIIVFVVGSVVVLELSFFAANAKPTRPPLTTISDDAMAMAKRAAVILLLNITTDHNATFLRNAKITKVHYIFRIFIDNASVKL